jgi:cellulase/cellobiase CelA1
MIDGAKFAKKKGQMITITLQKRDLDKATWQGWDTDVAAPDGAKTQNLNLFIGGLRDSVENVVQNIQQKKQATQEAVKYCLGFTRYE